MGDDPLHGTGPGGLQHRVYRQIAGRQTCRLLDRSCEYPPLDMAMQEALFEEIETYVLERQNTVAQYITMQPIMDLCKETVRIPETWFAKGWW